MVMTKKILSGLGAFVALLVSVYILVTFMEGHAPTPVNAVIATALIVIGAAVVSICLNLSK